MSAICELCFHHCKLEEGQTSLCRARTCRDGAVIPLNYGKLTSLDLDPIEKKPLRRFRPGSLILSVGSFGCKGYDTFGPFKLVGGICKGRPDENDLNSACHFFDGLS